MGWIEVRIKRNTQPKELIDLGIEPKEEDYTWSRTGILANDIDEFYEEDGLPGILTLQFINNKPDMEIQATFDEFKDMLNKDMELRLYLHESEAGEVEPE